MHIRKYIASVTMFAGLSLAPIGAYAQTVGVHIGGVGSAISGLGSSLGSGVGSLASIGGAGALGASTLGGGSLASVDVGSANATILPGGGIDVLGTANRGLGQVNAPGTTSLSDKNFFSSNQDRAGLGDGIDIGSTGTGGGGGGGTQFGANGSVEAQATRKRVVSTERARKLVKRRMSQIGATN